MHYALMNSTGTKKGEKNECLEIIKILYEAEPKLATGGTRRPVIVEAI